MFLTALYLALGGLPVKTLGNLVNFPATFSNDSCEIQSAYGFEPKPIPHGDALRRSG